MVTSVLKDPCFSDNGGFHEWLSCRGDNDEAFSHWRALQVSEVLCKPRDDGELVYLEPCLNNELPRQFCI